MNEWSIQNQNVQISVKLLYIYSASLENFKFNP